MASVNNDSVSGTPSGCERVIQLDETLHSVNSSAFEVRGFSESIPEDIGASLNESLFNAAISGEEVMNSTPKRKCVSKKVEYSEAVGVGDAVDSDDDKSWVPGDSTP